MSAFRRSIKRRLREGLASFLYYSGAIRPLRFLAEHLRLDFKQIHGVRLPWIRRRSTPILQIFTFHQVNDEHDPYLPAVPRRVFAEQMRYLAANYTICTPNQLGPMLDAGELPRGAVMITFDDGYHDVLTNAFPVLQKLGAPAIIFLPAAHIGTNRSLWHDQVVRAFRMTRVPSMPDYRTKDVQLPLTTGAERVSAFRATAEYLRTLDSVERESIIERLYKDLDVLPNNLPSHLLTWDEVRAMQDQGIEFGSHTVTHPILSRLDPADASWEIVESKRLIEAELGRPVRLLAYPNGTPADFTEANKKAASEAGYDAALTTVFGANRPGDDRYALRRGGPWDEHLPTFALKLVWYRMWF